ncbi:M phase phosphoprotein 10 [Cannabis sativa]|uniref:M phase phosphoprotein 10 n=1 Tax=Cannabis sativa TaxID=3483 RepID=UPI0029CA9AB9|nr:M phase phosphoprotein 10 [Cannabis sativa]
MAMSAEALHRLKATDPPQWLASSPTLSQTAREASQNLFSSLRPYTPKSPFDKLLVEGFDAEQIWQQIDLQSQPLLLTIRRELKRFEKDPAEIKKLKLVVEGEENGLEDGREKLEEESDEFDEDLDGIDEELDDDEEMEENEDEEEESGDEDEDEKVEEKDEEDDNSGGEFEDEFLKIKDLEEFMEEDEAREYGLKKKDKKKKKKKVDNEEEEEDEEEKEDDDDSDSDEIGDFGLGDDDDDEDGETDKLEGARYEDFFVGKKKNSSKRKSKFNDRDADEEDFGTNDDGLENEKTLSTHEKELEKLKSKIELMEKANLEPKTWTMQGEVTAAKRPKNSALEADLDFEHNVRPPPVITEEVTASLEEMIKKRILEGHFDDVEKPQALPSKAPRERKELDENKSKKGLAEIYEDEYVQKTNVASTLPFVEEEKQMASMLFKKLCLKLDALSHFHFTPKPVIEDMSIQANVPALAMEEIAPLAVSDAAMLAPEEVFLGKGDIKEDAELTQEERKRRRANKKRKFKAETEKKMANKPRDKTLANPNDAEAAKKARDST